MVYLYTGEVREVLDLINLPLAIHKSFSTVEEYKLVMASIEEVHFATPLILSDISLLSFRMAYMLKFIENYPNDLYLVGSFDNIIPTILSRVDEVSKLPYIDPYRGEDLEQFQQELLSDSSYIDHQQALQSIYKHAPEFLPFYLKTQKAKARRGVLELMAELK